MMKLWKDWMKLKSFVKLNRMSLDIPFYIHFVIFFYNVDFSFIMDISFKMLFRRINNMGLIRAAVRSATGVLADQYKEYFYCDALGSDVLVRKGRKRRANHNVGDDNVITNGSIVSVADGQCMLIVDNGKVVEVCAEPGEFKYDSSTEPTVFAGDLSSALTETLRTIGKRFTMGADSGRTQRVYYFNTKEIMGNKYGTPAPVPFRVVDTQLNFSLTTSIRCFGEYSYRIENPLLFYTNVCGNIENDFTRDKIDGQIKSELLTALQPAFGKISSMGIRYDELTLHTMELADAINEELSKKWRELRGIAIVSFGVSSVKAPEEDEARIKDMQTAAAYGSNAAMMAGRMGTATANAMENAAKNENGAMAGFMGMNMAQQAGGVNVNQMYQMAQQVTPQGWTCTCGQQGNTGNFCSACGSAKPIPKQATVEGWTCSCGAINQGKFCSECGAKKPVGVPQYKCDKCGWMPADPTKPPKFCPECGDPFGDEDIIK